MTFRIGQGIDIHPFEKGRKLMLGGIEVPHSSGLKGHSDADALLHAICDAMLGALALGDMGQYFSDQAPENKNRDSLFFLEEVRRMVRKKGFDVVNIDCTLLTEEPRLRPHIDAMRDKIAFALGISIDQVGIKATRPEKLGSFGRHEGLMAMAVVLLES